MRAAAGGLYFPADTLVPAAKRSRRSMIASPGWPALIVAWVLLWLRGRLLDLADRSMRRPRLGLAAIWLSDQCGRVGRRLLTIS